MMPTVDDVVRELGFARAVVDLAREYKMLPKASRPRPTGARKAKATVTPTGKRRGRPPKVSPPTA